jgi:predicted phosphodiesterase
VATAVVSDLHLGAARGDIARAGEARERLLEALAAADRIVLLGDVLELRERPVGEVLARARPFFEALGAAAAGRRVTIVPGNHDHALAEPWLSRLRLDGAVLGAEAEWRVAPGDGLAGRLAELMPAAELTLAYPGLRLRDDVYATHGHYLDLHLSVPRLETIAASAVRLASGRRAAPLRSAAEHEALLAPLYALGFGFAQGASPERLRRSGALSRSVFARAGDGRRGRRAAAVALAEVVIPAGVAALNRAGLGPFSADLSGEELRRAGLRAMGAVADGLRLDAAHVVFGHTHRPGPLPDDVAGEWRSPCGRRLWNSGSWVHEPVLLGGDARGSPYWPGTALYVPDEGEPALAAALAEVSLPGRSG